MKGSKILLAIMGHCGLLLLCLKGSFSTNKFILKTCLLPFPKCIKCSVCFIKRGKKILPIIPPARITAPELIILYLLSPNDTALV